MVKTLKKHVKALEKTLSETQLDMNFITEVERMLDSAYEALEEAKEAVFLKRKKAQQTKEYKNIV